MKTIKNIYNFILHNICITYECSNNDNVNVIFYINNCIIIHYINK